MGPSKKDLVDTPEQEARDQQNQRSVADLQQRLYDLTRLVSDWIWETDSFLRLSHVSPRVLQVLQFHPAELTGKTLTELGHFDDEASVIGAMDNRQPFRDALFEMADRGGTPHQFLISGLPVFDREDGAFLGMRGTAEDITERIRVERELVALNQNLEHLVEQRTRELRVKEAQLRVSDDRRKLASEQAGVAFWRWSFEQNRINDWSENYGEMIGFESGIPKNYEEMVSVLHPDDRETVHNVYQEADVGPSDYTVEYRVILPDGNERWIREHAEVEYDEEERAIAHIGVVQDITMFKKTQRDLKESRERLKQVVQVAPEAIITMDRSTRIRLFNQAAERIFGYTSEEIIGSPIEILIPPKYRGDHADHVEAFDTSAHTYLPMDNRTAVYGLRKNGEEFPAAISVSKIDFDGQRTYTVMLRDVTKRKRLLDDLRDSHEELKKTFVELERANQAKSEFLATMSHELRTPLNAIIGFSEMISSQVFGKLGDERYEEYLADIQKSGYLLLHIVNDVLDLSKIEAGRFELDEGEVDLDETLRSCLEIISGRKESRSLTLRYESASRPLNLRLDERAIKQVTLNLLSNAVKYNVEGGEVVLAVRLEKDNSIVYSVSDTGIGIAPTDIPKALEPFGQIRQNAHVAHEGTGLGLSLSKQIVELHGGTLELESDLGKGTIATVRLPSERIISC